MLTVWDTKREEGHGKRKKGEHQPSSLKVLAVNTEPLKGSASAPSGSADQAQP
nr:MAG TPA: hypothetical protein [Caudoviricetes sp.]